MDNTLDELQMALQKINPNVPETESQRVQSFNARAKYLYDQGAGDRAYAAQVQSEKTTVFGSQSQTDFGLNLPG